MANPHLYMEYAHLWDEIWVVHGWATDPKWEAPNPTQHAAWYQAARDHQPVSRNSTGSWILVTWLKMHDIDIYISIYI